ncbi:MAG: chromosomal replication initiator protein DnaA [Candidatus Moraniibacteriota bacterium]|nr:MAG: chromosomal replication initiator protein DnaA [Candidatus Moranbacteria bacterium]
MKYEELWKAVLGELELSVSKANFETWLLNTELVSIENSIARIAVGSPFTKEWLENRYNHIILQALQKQDSSIREISCFIRTSTDSTQKISPAPSTHTVEVSQSVAPDSSENSPSLHVHHTEKTWEDNIVSHDGMKREISPEALPSSTRMSLGVLPVHPIVGVGQDSPLPVSAPMVSHRPVTSNLNPRYTFENFIIGENNELARAASFAVSQSPGTLYNPLFIYGVVGVGKTHLLQSIGNEARRNHPDMVVRYTTSEQFTNELINHIKNQTMEDFKRSYREIDILLIDDVQFLSGREKTQQEFFHVFNNLHQLNKQVVITSDRTPRAIPTIEDRLKSRFEGGMIADVSRPDLETRMAILRLKLLEKGTTLEEDCIRFIAENITNNARELEGALNRVLVSAEFQKVRPTPAYVAKVLGQIITAHKQTVTLESITKIVAEFYNVPEEELYKKGRKKEIALARQTAMYLARTELDVSLSGVGKHFGGRDHTTVLHAVDRIQKDMEKDGHFKEDMVSLRERLYRE